LTFERSRVFGVEGFVRNCGLLKMAIIGG